MKKMKESKVLLNVLCLEDELKDAELLNEMLVDEGSLVNMDIATKEKEYLALLKGRNYDIILADYTLPGFDASTALKLALELQMDLVISEFESQMRWEKVPAYALPCLRKDGTVFYADINPNSIKNLQYFEELLNFGTMAA